MPPRRPNAEENRAVARFSPAFAGAFQVKSRGAFRTFPFFSQSINRVAAIFADRVIAAFGPHEPHRDPPVVENQRGDTSAPNEPIQKKDSDTPTPPDRAPDYGDQSEVRKEPCRDDDTEDRSAPPPRLASEKVGVAECVLVLRLCPVQGCFNS